MIRTFFTRLAVLLLSLTSVTCPAAAAELLGICIREISAECGQLYLDDRLLCTGDVLTGEQLGRISLFPEESEADRSVTVSYLPICSDGLGREAEMTLSWKGKENKVPVAEDSATETYKNLPNTASLKACDPEGEALTYALVRQPRRGTVELHDDGSFTYTPKKNKVGTDSFTYTATDPAGKVSREATVTVTILKPSDAAQYTDTLGRECRFAAEWMRHSGIFTGETLAQEPCFGPDKTVTQGEFLAMLVKTLDIPTEEEISCTGYEDAPVWLKPYLAAALRAGWTAGVEELDAQSCITGETASRLLENALNQPEAFCTLSTEALTRGEAAGLLYRAAQLKQSRKLDRVIAY